MRRHLVPVFALVLIGTFACGGQSSGGGTGTHALHATFLNLYVQDVFWQAANKGAERAARALGATLVEQDANISTTTQASQFDAAIARHDDVVLVAANDSQAIIPEVQKARAAGIKVCAVNLSIPGTYLDGTVVMDEIGGATVAGKYVLDWAKSANKKQINVLLMEVPQTQENGRLRTAGFAAAVTDPTSGVTVNLITKLGGGSLESVATALTDTLATTHIDAMYTESDFYSPALPTVLQQHGYTTAGGSNHVQWIGVGGIPGGMDAIRKGWQDATQNFPIDQQADACLRLGAAATEGKNLQTELPAIMKAAGMDPSTSSTQFKASTGLWVLQTATTITKDNVDSKAFWANQ